MPDEHGQQQSQSDRFWELMERSVIFQGILVIMIAGTYCYMVATGQQVPDALLALLQIIVGFFFGAKAAVNSSRELKKYLQYLGLERRQGQ